MEELNDTEGETPTMGETPMSETPTMGDTQPMGDTPTRAEPKMDDTHPDSEHESIGQRLEHLIHRQHDK